MIYTAITLIYNPNSTGPSKRLAERCARELQLALPKIKLELLPTEYAGHAEELAYECALASKRPLIIASGGDGAYHEVVNGIMRASAEGHNATAGLLPGGNANDHYNHMHEEGFVYAVQKGTARRIDLLQLHGVRHGEPFGRYAHSYIGLGFTPRIGTRLTRAKLNRWNEISIVVRSLLAVRGSRLVIDGVERSYRSVVFTNIGRMAKILNLAHESRIDDGRFEVSILDTRSRLHLLAALFKASTVGLGSTTQSTDFGFQTVRTTLVQLDGEVRQLDARTEARVTIHPKALRCII